MIILEKIKIAVIDDHTVLRQVLVRTLNSEYDMEVVGSWSSAEPALEYLLRDSFDIVIMDLKLPGMDGISATRQMKKMLPSVKIVMLSAFSGDDEVFNAIDAGVMGYLPKEVTVETLVDTIRLVHRGHAVISPELTRKVLNKFTEMKSLLSKSADLTSIEKEALKLASMGSSNQEIAAILKISERAVKSHFSDILKKLNAKDRTQAVAIALKTGLIE